MYISSPRFSDHSSRHGSRRRTRASALRAYSVKRTDADAWRERQNNGKQRCERRERINDFFIIK